jgi:hypothetical protein
LQILDDQNADHRAASSTSTSSLSQPCPRSTSNVAGIATTICSPKRSGRDSISQILSAAAVVRAVRCGSNYPRRRHSREDNMTSVEKTPAEMPALQLDDMQGIVLRSRPSPYVGTYLLLRVDDPTSGRQLIGRLAELVDFAANWWQPSLPASLNVALTYRGLEALELPPTSLNSSP